MLQWGYFFKRRLSASYFQISRAGFHDVWERNIALSGINQVYQRWNCNEKARTAGIS